MKKKTFRWNIVLYHVGIHWVLSKMPFSLIKAIDLKLFVFRTKNLTFIYICDKIFFSKEIIYQKIYINNDNLIFSKSQHKIMVKLCGVEKIWRQHRVKDTIALQNMLKFWNVFDKYYFLLGSLKKIYRENQHFWRFQHIITGKLFDLWEIWRLYRV